MIALEAAQVLYAIRGFVDMPSLETKDPEMYTRFLTWIGNVMELAAD